MGEDLFVLGSATAMDGWGVQAWFVEERYGGSRTGGAGSSGTAAATGTGTGTTMPLPPPAGSASGGRPAWWSGSTTAGTTLTVIRQGRPHSYPSPLQNRRGSAIRLTLSLCFVSWMDRQGLVEVLTGEKRVLESLRLRGDGS